MTAILILGVAVGLIMGLTGAGGGVLTVPLLVFLTGLPVQSVAPIGLLAVAVAAAIAAIIGLKAGEVRYKAAMLMGAVGLVCSPAGLWLAQRSDPKALGLGFAAVLIWVAFNAIRTSATTIGDSIDAPPESQRSQCPCIQSPVTGRFIWTWPCARALVLAGGIAGFMSGMLGVGGGFVLIPALQRFTNLNNQSVTLTSLAVIAIVSAFGVINSANAGVFNHEIGMPFAAAALIGMLTARRFAAKIPVRHMRRLFGLLCLMVAVLMLIKNI